MSQKELLYKGRDAVDSKSARFLVLQHFHYSKVGINHVRGIRVMEFAGDDPTGLRFTGVTNQRIDGSNRNDDGCTHAHACERVGANESTRRCTRAHRKHVRGGLTRLHRFLASVGSRLTYPSHQIPMEEPFHSSGFWQPGASAPGQPPTARKDEAKPVVFNPNASRGIQAQRFALPIFEHSTQLFLPKETFQTPRRSHSSE